MDMALHRKVISVASVFLTLLALGAANLGSGLLPAQAAADTPTPTPGPNRKTTITVPFVVHQWMLLYWSDNSLACDLFIEHEGLPNADDIQIQCGAQIESQWLDTGPCTLESPDQNTTNCSGLYLHQVGNYAYQRDIEINLPPPSVWISVTGCNPVPPKNACDQLPELLLTGEEPLPNESIISLQGTLDGDPFQCSGSTCSLPLKPTGPQGVTVEFWGDSSFGDSTEHYTAQVRVVSYGDFMAPEGVTDTKQTWYVDVLSSQWQGPPLASCSQTWDAFPEVGGPPVWLTTPENASDLASNAPYYNLAGILIENHIVDASECPEGGLLSPGVASACGMTKAKDTVSNWQNSFDQEIISVATDTGVPAQLMKRIFSKESQFWPGMYTSMNEVGLGQLTENGADTLLLWNYSFYSQFCPLVLSADACQSGFSLLPSDQQAMLRGALLNQVNSSCPTCTSGIDLSKANFSVRVFARSLLANCEQVGGLVSAATRKEPGQVASYSDLWRFTLANYHSGSGCLQDAINTVASQNQPMTWDNVSAELSSYCPGTVEYVNDLTAEGPPGVLPAEATPTPTPAPTSTSVPTPMPTFTPTQVP